MLGSFVAPCIAPHQVIVSLKEGLFTGANVLFKARFRDGTSIVEVRCPPCTLARYVRLILRLLCAIASGKPLKGCVDVESRQGQSWIGREGARNNEQADKGQMINTLPPCIVFKGLFSSSSVTALLRVQYGRCCIGLTLLSCVSLWSCRIS
jgi:hypothetical protein